jgi:microcystin-dependent protein
MANPYLGEIRVFGFGFAPQGWAQCNGQTLSISANTALFALLGTTYGGNGTSTFQLPDLRGRVSVHQGQGAGLPPFVLGEPTGTPSNALTISNLPAHSHPVNADDRGSTSGRPAGTIPGVSGSNIYSSNAANSIMSPNMIGLTGSSMPVNNLQPLLCVNFCIALEGIFPARN